MSEHSKPEATRHTLLLQAPPDNVDAVHALLETVWAHDVLVSAADRVRFETALIELASNVLQHTDTGSGVTCYLWVEISAEQIVATLRDSGAKGVAELPDSGMPDELAEGGRGLPLIHALVDELDYQRDGDMNEWRIVRRLSA
ncbi:ATP-binding protein [Cryobacterium frigoriphilum]|uniref:ATP-binding protein n=1 Tax=Cryobacterium frigoriphilum TaxID=1259150 RepID=A0A4R8ZWU6_9MICO|nr:ATP-binding protein [Cryobacterium frigoriphilum]TFD48150.1 ATP-binding protein [Cryobacterium frigoriphilum]